MTGEPDNVATAARLLGVKRIHGLAAQPPPPPEPAVAPPDAGVACINCGYSQQGKPADDHDDGVGDVLHVRRPAIPN